MDLYKVEGVDDYEGLTFAITTTYEKAEKAKEALREAWELDDIEDVPVEVTKLELDTINIDGKDVQL
jgi:hypothetical protein